LRERGDDIVKLAEFFLRGLCRKYRQPLKQISATGRQRLLGYHWPGNVRELAHELERALVFEETEELGFAHLPGSLVAAPAETQPGERPDWLALGFRFPEQGFALEEAVNRFIRLALAQTDGNVSAAARLLGVPRDFIRYRLGQKTRKPDGN
jgi:DNA-binding NtrC family response regulator